jgi:hypothetical protein
MALMALACWQPANNMPLLSSLLRLAYSLSGSASALLLLPSISSAWHLQLANQRLAVARQQRSRWRNGIPYGVPCCRRNASLRLLQAKPYGGKANRHRSLMDRLVQQPAA